MPSTAPHATGAYVQPLGALTTPGTLLRLPTVQAGVGLAKRTIYHKMALGEFPKPVRIGVRCVRWRSDDINAWLAAQGGDA